MQFIKRYLLRYAWDVFIFLRAYALACVGIAPLVVIAFGIYTPVVYLFIGGVGLISIVIFAVLTGLFDSYRYKLLIFIGVIAYYSFAMGSTLSFKPPSNAINPNLLLFVYLILLFPAAYAYLERKGIKRHFERMVTSDEAEALRG